MATHCEDLIDRNRTTIRNYETRIVVVRTTPRRIVDHPFLTPFPTERLFFFSRFSALQNHPPPPRGSSPFRTAERAQRAQMENGLINRSNYRSATPLIRYPTPGHPSRPPEGSVYGTRWWWWCGARGGPFQARTTRLDERETPSRLTRRGWRATAK